MRKVNNLKVKVLLFLLIIALQIIMMSTNVFATENVENTSCDEGAHDFSIKKYDENNHWNECSVCGAVDEQVSHYYDENGDITCNGCSYEREIVEYISIDKNLMSEGETATITVKVIDGYTAKWIYFYKPITNNTKTVDLYLDSDNTYTGTFKVDDQTESGIWKVRNLTLKNAEDEYSYLYNSNTYTDSYYDKYDFSALNFEVTGTDADVSTPVIESYSIDKAIVSVGEKVTVTVQITDDHLPARCTISFESPSNEFEYISMKKVDDTRFISGLISNRRKL